MAYNKNALIRYKTIDKCLQNRYRKWTLEDLIEACSDALYEHEGKMTNVSKRTIQLDIQSITFYPKPPRKDWHQRTEFEKNTTIIQVYLSGRFQSEPKLKVVPGTHKQILPPDKTGMIINNIIPTECRVQFGGIILTKAHTLQQYQRHTEKGSAYVEIVLLDQ